MYLIKNIKKFFAYLCAMAILIYSTAAYANFDKIKWGMTQEQLFKNYKITNDGDFLIEIPVTLIKNYGEFSNIIYKNGKIVVIFDRKIGVFRIDIPTELDFYELKSKFLSIFGSPVSEITSCPNTPHVMCMVGATFLDKNNKNCVLLIKSDQNNEENNKKNLAGISLQSDKFCISYKYPG